MARFFTADSVKKTGIATFPITGYPFTLCGWVKYTGTPAAGSGHCIIAGADNTTSSQQYFLFLLETTGNINAVQFIHNATFNENKGTVNLTADVWHHVVGVYASATDRRQYVNGSLDGNSTASFAIPSNLDSIGLGASVDSTPSSIAANVDIAECAQWDGELTVPQIVALSKGVSPLNIRNDVLAGYWPVTGNTSPEPDFSGKGNGLTVTGTIKSNHPPVGRPILFNTRQAGPAVTEKIVEIIHLGQKWITNSVIKEQNKLGQKWITAKIIKATNNFNQIWKIFIRKKESNNLGQKWNVIVPKKATNNIGQKWIIDPVAIKSLPNFLGQKWEVFWGPFTSWVLPYAIKVSSEWDLLYNAIVAQQWILPSLGTVSQAWQLPYSVVTDLAKQFQLIWDLDTGDDVAQGWVLPYNYGKVAAQWQLTYSLSTPIAQQWTLEYGLTFPVVKQWSLDWDINTFDNVNQAWRLVYAHIGPEIINISGQPTITLNGNVIDVFDAEISTDEEGFIWQAEITLLDIGDYKSINIDDQFTLNFYGEIFTLLTESKTLDRSSPVGLAMTVRAVSPAVRHDFPRAAPLTVNYSTPVMAKATAEAVLGESITWSIPDWSIPANRLGIADGAPIQLVQQIVSAVGGVLESNPDGTLVARPKFPVSMNILEDDAQTPSIDQNYFDTADNLSVSEEYTPQKLFNKFRISDTVKEFNDDLDFDFDETVEADGSITKSDTEGLLKAFVKPFRTNVVVKSSQDASIGFQLNGVNTEQLTELVEIKEGIGSVSKPILSIDSFTYEAINLGTPTFVVDDTQIVTPNVNLKYGLVEITYTTHFIEYDVTGVNGKNVQFRLETVDI